MENVTTSCLLSLLHSILFQFFLCLPPQKDELQEKLESGGMFSLAVTVVGCHNFGLSYVGLFFFQVGVERET